MKMKKLALALLPFAVAPLVQAQDSICGGIGTSAGSYTAASDDPFLTISPNDVYYRCQLSGIISSDTTLAPSYRVGRTTYYVVWELDGVVEVGNGGGVMDNNTTVEGQPLQNVTLTLQAGVHFRSQARGSLVITRGSQLIAAGTSANPVTFASLDNDYAGSQEWGGLVIMGMAKTNATNLKDDESSPAYGDVCGDSDVDGDGICNIVAEGLDRDQNGVADVYFGGYNDADNSGSLNYVVIAEGGFELAAASEVNGLTLYTVGSGTTIQNVQVHGNSDDGVEFFGGAVNVNNLVLTANDDDSIDWDLGYRGAITNAYVEKCDGSDHGMELSGIDPDIDPTFTATPLTNPTATNVTLVAYGSTDAALNLKEGTGGAFDNLYVSVPGSAGFANCVKEGDSTLSFGRTSFDRVTLGCTGAAAAYTDLSVAQPNAATPVANFWSGWTIPATGSSAICN